MNRPIITIVVPVYKVPYELLKVCLDSICNQTADNFEAILIDDGSPDECGKICDEYAKRHSFFKVIHQENVGLAMVRNVGVERAEGEYVCFVDGDDWIEANTIDFAIDYIKRVEDKWKGADVLIWDEFYDIDQISKPNRLIDVPEDKPNKMYLFRNMDKERLFDCFFPRIHKPFKNNFIDLGCTHARLYKKKFLQDNKIQNTPGLKRMQDNVFNLWVFEKADQVVYQCERLYHYRFNEDAATQRYSSSNVDTMYFLYECMEDFVVSNHKDDSDYYQRLYCRFMRIFGEIFKLNYANPNNPKSLNDRLWEIRRDFSREKFKNVIDYFDTTEQNRKLVFIRNRLKHKNYLFLIIYYMVSIKTRKFRLQLRETK